MTKFYLFVVSFGLTCSVFAQIPNASFEDWTAGNPNGWEVSNQAPLLVTVSQSTDAQAGTSSANLTVSSFQGLVIGGAMTATNFPVTIEPVTFIFWYKASFDQGDMFTVAAEVDDANGAVRTGTATISANSNVWTMYEFNLDELNTNTPTLGNITFFTQGPDGDIFSVHPNTSIYIDDISFGYIVNTEEVNADLTIQSVYPNPSNDFAYVQYANPKPSKVRVEIFDLSGKCAAVPFNANQASGNYRVELPIEMLSSGLYTCRVTSEKATVSSTFLVE